MNIEAQICYYLRTIEEHTQAQFFVSAEYFDRKFVSFHSHLKHFYFQVVYMETCSSKPSSSNFV